MKATLLLYSGGGNANDAIIIGLRHQSLFELELLEYTALFSYLNLFNINRLDYV